MNAQTGAVQVQHTIDRLAASASGLTLTPNGTFVLAFVPSSDGSRRAVVLHTNGTLRGDISAPGGSFASLGDDGATVAVASGAAIAVWEWDAAAQAYALTTTHALPPSSNLTWEIVNVQLTRRGSQPVAVVLLSSTSRRDVRVVALGAWTGAVLTDWALVMGPPRRSYNLASLTCDGEYCGVALVGSFGTTPTSVLLQLGSSTPVFSSAS